MEHYSIFIGYHNIFYREGKNQSLKTSLLTACLSVRPSSHPHFFIISMEDQQKPNPQKVGPFPPPPPSPSQSPRKDKNTKDKEEEDGEESIFKVPFSRPDKRKNTNPNDPPPPPLGNAVLDTIQKSMREHFQRHSKDTNGRTDKKRKTKDIPSQKRDLDLEVQRERHEIHMRWKAFIKVLMIELDRHKESSGRNTTAPINRRDGSSSSGTSSVGHGDSKKYPNSYDALF